MIWTDEDGDTLEIKEVYGLGRRILLVRAVQEGQESQLNIDEAQAKEVAELLGKWASVEKLQGR